LRKMHPRGTRRTYTKHNQIYDAEMRCFNLFYFLLCVTTLGFGIYGGLSVSSEYACVSWIEETCSKH
jgi:hypothetical protein